MVQSPPKMNSKKSFTTSRYGWQPDLPDHRDYLYAAPLAALGLVPAKMDLRSQCPPVYDQGQLGSCTANAIGAAIQKGYFTLPYAYVTDENLASDFWTVRIVQ